MFGDAADVSSSDEEHASIVLEEEEEAVDAEGISKSPAAKAENETEVGVSDKEKLEAKSADEEREPTGRFPGVVHD